MMDASVGSLVAPTTLDDPLLQVRDLPQINRLHIPPLRDPVPSRSLRVPSPVEPNADGPRESSIPKKHGLLNGNPPAELPTLEDLLRTARTNSLNQSVSETLPHHEPPPKTIQPAFINLRAVEKLPYSSFDDDGPRKHRRIELHGDGFGEHLQLPIPNIQKSTAKPPPFGPLTILNGLNEPPPNAALFPPIEPDAVPTILTRLTKDSSTPVEQAVPEAAEERRGRRISEIIDTNFEETGHQQASKNELEETEHIAKPTVGEDIKSSTPEKAGGKPRKKLRKWTEQETTDLLRGVVTCGVGNWTAILAQPELKFNNRTAANLKDRFRVCCPWAYGPDQKPTSEVQTSLAEAVNGSDLSCGKIVLPDPRHVKSGGDATFSKTTHSNAAFGTSPPQVSTGADETSNNPFTSANSQRGNKNHASPDESQSLSNKSKSTLKSLGLSEPHLIVRSNRRSRRPFTPAEDEALLKGYAVHGFQWTLIQQDKHLNLMHRRATDLRDRFRTKFPNVYREGGSATAKVIKANGKDGDHGPPATSTSAGTTTTTLPLTGEKPRPMDAPTSSQPPIHDHSAVPVDHVVHPPAPPPPNAPEPSSTGSKSIIPFLLDDSGPSGGENSDIRWADNTLPPLVWDELG